MFMGKRKLSKVRKWRQILDALLVENEKNLKWLCDYIGSAYNENSVSFYEKLPKRRTTYIGIGMAFHQSLDVINGWILSFTDKRKLYVKDISEDLVWIYLIQMNHDSPDSEINYFQRYEECQSVAYSAYREVWDDVMLGSLGTTDVEVRLDKAEHDQEFKGLRQFIVNNIDSFKTAYTRPRAFLERYLNALLLSNAEDKESMSLNNLNRMRGYLDDSMINYLSGDSSTINTVDRFTRTRTINIKHIPKNRKFHVSLCLALGMTVPDINYYLDMMGYKPLDSDDRLERVLIDLLERWEEKHPLQRKFKQELIYPERQPELKNRASDFAGVQEELLFLREEMYFGFKERGLPYPYINR